MGGFLHVGINHNHEVILNLGQDMTGHVVFSANEARQLASLLHVKATESENFDARIIKRFGKYAIIGPYDSRGVNCLFGVYRTETEIGPIIGCSLGEFCDKHDAEVFAEAIFEHDDGARLNKLRDKYDPD